jgi:hypothetical protein
MVQDNYIAGYSQNDFFYMKTGNGESCNGMPTPCQNNQDKAKQLRQMRDEYSASLEKHDNVLKMYNREMAHTINLIIGIGLLSYYIYVNKKSIMQA